MAHQDFRSNRSGNGTEQESTIPARGFLPVTDIFEIGQALTVVLEMPGVNNDNVDVGVENDILTITGRMDF